MLCTPIVPRPTDDAPRAHIGVPAVHPPGEPRRRGWNRGIPRSGVLGRAHGRAERPAGIASAPWERGTNFDDQVRAWKTRAARDEVRKELWCPSDGSRRDRARAGYDGAPQPEGRHGQRALAREVCLSLRTSLETKVVVLIGHMLAASTSRRRCCSSTATARRARYSNTMRSRRRVCSSWGEPHQSSRPFKTAH